MARAQAITEQVKTTIYLDRYFYGVCAVTVVFRVPLQYEDRTRHVSSLAYISSINLNGDGSDGGRGKGQHSGKRAWRRCMISVQDIVLREQHYSNLRTQSAGRATLHNCKDLDLVQIGNELLRN